MKKGKRIRENNNIYIYMGTIIFFVLAIGLGITMYVLSRQTTKIESNIGEGSVEQQITEDFEDVTTEIGKTVEEQKEAPKEENTNTTNSNEVANKTENQENSGKIEKTGDSKDSNKQENTTEKKETKEETQKDTTKENKKEITFTKPSEGEIICGYAKENLVYSETLKEWITHTAIDIKTDKTSVIKSAADGIVKSIINDPRYGLTIIIEHDDGYETVYSNLLTAEFVVEGETVKQGQTVGTAGDTAAFESCMESHLHFELMKDGEYLDPSIYIK